MAIFNIHPRKETPTSEERAELYRLSISGHTAGAIHELRGGGTYKVQPSGAWERISAKRHEVKDRNCVLSFNAPHNNGRRRRIVAERS